MQQKCIRPVIQISLPVYSAVRNYLAEVCFLQGAFALFSHRVIFTLENNFKY